MQQQQQQPTHFAVAFLSHILILQMIHNTHSHNTIGWKNVVDIHSLYSSLCSWVCVCVCACEDGIFLHFYWVALIYIYINSGYGIEDEGKRTGNNGAEKNTCHASNVKHVQLRTIRKWHKMFISTITAASINATTSKHQPFNDNVFQFNE